MLAAIPYTTFPTISLGPFDLRAFGFLVAIGVLLGAWLAARYGESKGVPRDTTYALAMRMVLGGVVGSRITWVLSHTDQIDSPLDVIAIWQGGLQFTGGFLFAVPLGYPVYRKWNRLTRWNSLDGYAYGLAIGLAIGRIACFSVGEHFGRLSNFFLAVRYEGGSVREGTIGDVPLRKDMVFHHTALYEMLYLFLLFLILTYLLHLRKQKPQAGTAMALFCFWYGCWRFWSDSLRVNDERVLHMTGAQYFCMGLILASIWIWFRVRRQLREDVASGMVTGIEGATPVPAGAPPLTEASQVDDEADPSDG